MKKENVKKKKDVANNKKNEEKIVVNLEKNDDESVNQLPEEEQIKYRKLQKKLREELGLSDDEKSKALIDPVMQDIIEDASHDKESEEFEKNKQSLEDRINESKQKELGEAVNKAQDKYSAFIKNYSKKDDLSELTTFGKYDSDLDFRLNRKIKKIRFPMPKKVKILLTCLAAVLLIATGVILPFALYKEPPEILLTKLTCTQPLDSEKVYYLVSNVFVGDSLAYDNIYLNCEYSDGHTEKISLQDTMVTHVTGNVTDGVFTDSGTAVVNVKYQSFTLKLKYIIQEKELTGITLFNVLEIKSTTLGQIDLNDKLTVNAAYSNAPSLKVNLDECTFKIAGTTLNTDNGILTLPELSANTYDVEVSYQEKTAIFTIIIEQPVTNSN